MKTRKSKLLGLALIAFLWSSAGDPAAAQQRLIRFDRITLDAGLSQGAINCVLQDRTGFMWFGTQDGLNQFDGYRFSVLRHDPEDPTSLSTNWVWACVEDRRGRIWVGTEKGGLNRWDPETQSFDRFRHDPTNPTSLSHDTVRAVFEDRQGRIWVGTEAGLNLFQPSSGTFRHFNHNPSNPDSLSHDVIRSLAQDPSGQLWVATEGGGLSRLDPATGRATTFRHDPADPTSLSGNRVRFVYTDLAGQIWAGTYEAGLNRFDADAEAWTRFAWDAADASSLSNNRVQWILEDREGVLWVGTDGGLNEFLPASQSFVRFQRNPSDPGSLADDRVMCLFQDRGGVLWVGTRSGIYKWNPLTTGFLGYQHNPSAQHTLSSNQVHSFAEGADGGLWVGTHDGLNRLDRTTGNIDHFRRSPGEPGGLRDGRIMSLLAAGDDTLWVGTFEAGLHRLDLTTGRFRQYAHDPDDPDSLGGNGVTALLLDSQGVLWAGTYGGGLNRYVPETDSFIRYLHDPARPNSLSNNKVLALYEDSLGTLWVGTDGAGLAGLDRVNGTFHHIHTGQRNRFGLFSDTVWALHEDRNGTLWMGTQGNGLFAWDRKNRDNHRVFFKSYSREEGLANDVIYGILEDQQGRIWVSTNQGISQLDPASGQIRNYDETHGLLSREFNFGAALSTSSGEMLFGSDRGFNIFRPDAVRANPHAPPVVLTSFRILNREVETGRPLTELRQIELTHRDQVVSFEFAALDYTAPGKNRYAYRLEGFDEEWIELGNERRVTYTNLDAGTYILRVRGANNDGFWNPEGVALELRVLPPPWQSWWAYSLYALAVLGVIVSYGRAQGRKLEQEAEYSRKLEQEVQSRTSELAERNRLLEDLNGRLEKASYTDSLTGLLNRRYLARSIEQDVALVDRFHIDLTESGVDRSLARPDCLFLFFDLDDFKKINDTYGHAAGDQALVQIRSLLEGTCRKSDTIIRWGGDEFLIIGRYTDRSAADLLAERLCAAVREHPFRLDDGRVLRLTCSIGFSYYPFVSRAPANLNWEQVLTIADRALYIAKNSGRDAWVGLRETDLTAEWVADELLAAVDSEIERLIDDEVLELRSSIPDRSRLVWAWG